MNFKSIIVLAAIAATFVACQKEEFPSSGTGTENGHSYVDLGLTSGTLWATTNVGADNPQDFGNFYAWGETETKDIYDWNSYKFSNDDDENYHPANLYINKYTFADKESKSIWYNSKNVFIGDSLLELEPVDDVAVMKWGGKWRMPTRDQMTELREECNWKWEKYNGSEGYIVKGKNGNAIFLPAAGFKGTGDWLNGEFGYYWTRSLDYGKTGKSYCASGIYFTEKESLYRGFFHYRKFGQSVRPVINTIDK